MNKFISIHMQTLATISTSPFIATQFLAIISKSRSEFVLKRCVISWLIILTLSKTLRPKRYYIKQLKKLSNTIFPLKKNTNIFLLFYKRSNSSPSKRSLRSLNYKCAHSFPVVITLWSCVIKAKLSVLLLRDTRCSLKLVSKKTRCWPCATRDVPGRAWFQLSFIASHWFILW